MLMSRNRASLDVAAADALRCLQDPVIVDAVSSFEKSVMTVIANYDNDGSDEASNFLLEKCRQLQTMQALKSHMLGKVQAARLRESTPPREKTDKPINEGI